MKKLIFILLFLSCASLHKEITDFGNQYFPIWEFYIDTDSNNKVDCIVWILDDKETNLFGDVAICYGYPYREVLGIYYRKGMNTYRYWWTDDKPVLILKGFYIGDRQIW